MRFGEDPDIEGYLELRRAGKVGAALAIYNGALRSRYPDDASLMALLALRRANDPRWRELHTRLPGDLATTLESRASRNIDAILEALPPASRGDAYGSLRAVDTLLRRLGANESPERALETVGRHLRLARILEEDLPMTHRRRVRALERVDDLLREYSALSKMEDPDEQDFVARSRFIESRRGGSSRRTSTIGDFEKGHDFVARSRAREETRKEAERARARYFDLARLRFSIRDRALIELENPPNVHEDLVLAWCAKYWRLSLDPAFERTVFLYSRKYGTKHFAIFRELRSGRLRGRSDDELLSALSSLLSMGYSYSITGDMYMRARWKRMKAGLFEEPAGAAGGAKERSSPPSIQRRITKGRPAAGEPAAPAVGVKMAPIMTKLGMAEHGPGAAFSPRSARSAQASLARARVAEPVRALGQGSTGSISDKIRRLSGRQYDVYRTIFLEKVREYIHRKLISTRDRPATLFDTSANEAEDVIYGFIAGRYDDPFMNWETSSERAFVEGLGFRLPNLDGIIEDCYRKL
ncbi:MAG: hypothetical protein WCL50_13345 [Spirochaetota bacterium]